MCPDCGQMRPFEKQQSSMVGHLILSVLTLGLWLPVAGLVAVGNAFGKSRCRECGYCRR